MKILMIGCGNLGSALLYSLVTKKEANIIVVQPSLSRGSEFSQYRNVKFIADYGELPNEFVPDYMILAIKPQQLRAVLPRYSITGNTVLISLLAGTSITTLQQVCKEKEIKIIRIMPNLAMKFGKSVNLAYCNANAAEYLAEVEYLLSASGTLITLEREEMIDALTPLSGSGPAFFILLTQLIKDLALKAGLSEELSSQLAQQTLVGSAYLAEESLDFQGIINCVASKGGLTEAALQILQPQLPVLLAQAYQVAIERGTSILNSTSK